MMFLHRPPFLSRCISAVSVLFVSCLCFSILDGISVVVDAQVSSFQSVSKGDFGGPTANVRNNNHSVAFLPTNPIHATDVSLDNDAPSSEEICNRYYIPAHSVPEVSHLMTPNNTIHFKNNGAVLTLCEKNRHKLQRGMIEGGAKLAGFFILAPPIAPGAHVYRAVYDLRGVTRPLLRQVFKWCWKYLERGSNIKFEEYDPARPAQAYITVRETKLGCESTLGLTGTMDLGPECALPGALLHETLHSLGIPHEHQRPDRGNYLTMLPAATADPYWSRALSIVDSVGLTQYDYASIMHYSSEVAPVGKTFIVNQPQHDRVVQGARISLSSCDWAALNTLYPGKRKPFPCHPHKVHQFLVPVRHPYYIVSQDECIYNNQYYFMKQLCVSKNNMGYPYMPTLEEELGFSPFKQKKRIQKRRPSIRTKIKAGDSTVSKEKLTSNPTARRSTHNTKTRTLRTGTASRTPGPIRQRTRTEKVTRPEDTTTEIDEQPEASTPRRVSTPEGEDHSGRIELNRRMRRYHGFTSESCASLISLEPNVLDDRQCRRACLEGCNENFPGKSIQECLSIGYYICVPSNLSTSSALFLASSTLTNTLLLGILWQFL